MRKVLIILIVSAIGVSLLFLTSLGKEKTILQVGMQDEPITINPFRARDVWSSHVISPVLSSLLGYDENFQIIPMLAESWEAKPEEGKVVVYLKKGVKWHDGSEFTAEDVVYTVNIIKHFEFPLFFYKFEYVKEVRAIDNYTIEYILDMDSLYSGQETSSKSIPPVFYVDTLMQFIIQKKQWEPAFKEALSKEDPLLEFWSWMPEKLQGTGPFTFAEWKKGSYVYLEKNPNYYLSGSEFYGKKVGPFIDGILFQIYRSTDIALLALKAGEIDYIAWPLQKGFADDLKKDSDVIVSENKANGFFYLGANLRKEPWNDIHFRKAVNTAIDRDFIVKRILQSEGGPLYTTVPPGNEFWHNPDITKPEGGIDEAREILAGAGYRWENKRLINPDGKKTEPIQLISPPADYDPLRYQSAMLIQRWLSQLGISVTVRPLSFQEIVVKVFDQQDFDLFILGWSLGIDPDYLRVFYASRFDTPGGYNAYGYHSDEYDKLAKKSMLESDQKMRKEIIYKMQELIARDVPVFPLYIRTVLEGRSKRFEGWVENLGGIGSTWSYVYIKPEK